MRRPRGGRATLASGLALAFALALAGGLAPWPARAQEGGAAPPGGPGEAVDLRPRYAEGDRLEVEARMTLVLRLRLVAASVGLDRTSEQEQVVLRRYRDRVGACAGERVDQVERRFLEAWDGLRLPGARELERTPSPLHQRRVLVVRDREGRRRARLPEEDRVAVPREVLDDEGFTERWEALLPREPVAPGARWAVDGEALRAALGSGLARAEGEATASFVCLARGERLEPGAAPGDYAVVDLRLDVAGPVGDEPDAPRMRAVLTGSLWFDLAARKLAKVHLEGEARLRQTRTEGEATVELDGKGPLVISKRLWFPERPPPPPPGQPGSGARPVDPGLPPPR